MSTQEPSDRVPGADADVAAAARGHAADQPTAASTETAVREAFEAFRRHALQLQAQLRVLQAAGGTVEDRADRRTRSAWTRCT